MQPEKIGVDDALARNGHGLDDLARTAVPLAEAGLGAAPKAWRALPTVDALGKAGWHFARGGGLLHSYDGGVYRPAKARLLNHLARWMGSEWTPARADAVVRFCLDASQELPERPPLRTLNVKNGLLDLDTGELRPHDPAFLSTVQLAVSFDPKAQCPAVQKFVGEVFPPDALRLAYELAGWLCVPDTSWQKAVMLVGTGNNGKGTYLRLLTALLGKENVSTVTLQAMGLNRFSAADLYGRMANICGDLPANALESTDLFKQVTGEDRLTGEHKYGDAFSFAPFSRLLFSANEPPPTPDGSYAFFRRWLIVPFPRQFSEAEADKALDAKLQRPEELSGFLNLSLLAYEEARERNAFTTSASLHQASADFKANVDPVAAFLAERTAADPNGQINKGELYAVYKEWAAQSGHRALSAKRFNARVPVHHPESTLVAINGYPTWKGFGLVGS